MWERIISGLSLIVEEFGTVFLGTVLWLGLVYCLLRFVLIPSAAPTATGRLAPCTPVEAPAAGRQAKQ